MKKTIASAAVAAALTGAVVAAAPTAQAATARNGVCETGEFCLYYNSGNGGSLVDLANSQSDYGTGSGCVTFVSAGNGQGQCVKNNAASVWNRGPPWRRSSTGAATPGPSTRSTRASWRTCVRS
ncbi:peptidase inhibitor family I36 protein [Terrabacter sp. Soil811]|uniref:peptidase inhibitor family I36 protein n=1 Tax=Terrabacter sp. Soil811 TaxID=1736419 RepID=UPI000A539067|nr:peptidase inhibitor family I36 protein [Terrabacter sp. Soil811]